MRRRREGLAIVLVFVIGGGITAAMIIANSGRFSAGASSPATPGALSTTATAAPGDPVTTRDQAAKWIAGQVAPSAIVACDPAMCAALEATGIPAGKLLTLNATATDPLGSDLVVGTPALRSQFGARLASVYAPAVLASFGAGANAIEVRVTAPEGAAAYQSALAADSRARAAAGRELVGNPRVGVAPAARTALLAGEVDPRLLAVLPTLAAQQPVRILAFTDPSPGAIPVAPLRGAEIAPRPGASTGTGTLESMMSFLSAQQVPYHPLRITTSGGGLTVEYAAPSPLGLLDGS
jgi:hypothetical protein